MRSEVVNSTQTNESESVQDNILKAPGEVTEQAKAQYEKTTAALTEYLRKTNLEELDPDGIERDLQLLLKDPKAGFNSLGDRFGDFDRSRLNLRIVTSLQSRR